MELKDLCSLIANALSDEKQIIHTHESDNSILVTSENGSSFYISVLKSSNPFANANEDNQFIEEYMSTHSKENFTKSLTEMTAEQPGFIFYYIIMLKLKDMKIIDENLLYHIMDHIVRNTEEFNVFTSKLLDRFQ